MRPKTSPRVQRGVVDLAINPLKRSEVVRTTVDEETLIASVANRSPDMGSHLARAGEMAARPRVDVNATLPDLPVDFATAGCNAQTDGPNGPDHDGFQSGSDTDLRQMQSELKGPTSLVVIGNATMTNSPIFASVPSLVAGPTQSLEKRPTILLIDDEPLYLELISDILGADYKILVADEGMTGLEIATKNVPHLILLDLMMPGIDGFEVYRCLEADSRTSGIPVIFITGLGDVATETRGLRVGAVDFINKPINPDLIKARVNTQINFKLMRDKLVMLSETDGLTGLANRCHFDSMLAYEYSRHLRSGKEMALIMLDIDQFKGFNDAYGHVSGDECLRKVSRAMTKTVSRATDLVARYGGEEFVILLPETGLRGAVILAEKVRKCIGDLAIPHKDSDAGHVTASLGVVSGKFLTTSSILNVLTEADIQLYAAKAGGRNRVAFRAIGRFGQMD